MLAMMVQRVAELEGDAAAEEEKQSASALIETHIGKLRFPTYFSNARRYAKHVAGGSEPVSAGPRYLGLPPHAASRKLLCLL